MTTISDSPPGGLTAAQVQLVQTSFASVQPISQAAARLFYQRLFDLDPSLRPMFRRDVEEQGRKLMMMLAIVIGSLNRLETIIPAIEAMGQRHAAYGVLDRHYETVAQALLWTLERGLGIAFTPEVAKAWAAVYGIVAGAMQRGSAMVATA